MSEQHRATAAASMLREPIRPSARFVHLLGAWTLLFLGNPGVALGAASAFAGLVWLAWATCVPTRAPQRPGWRSSPVWLDWGAAAAGLSAQCFWSTKVLWITLLAVAIVPGLYYALAAQLARRLAAGFAPAISVALAFSSLEVLRTQIEPPFAFGWMRTAHYFAGPDGWVAPVRVLGAAGTGFCLLLASATVAQWLLQRRGRCVPLQSGRRLAVQFAAALALPAACGLLVAPPATESAGRALLVQPSFEQRRKMEPRSAQELFRESLELTREGLAAHGPVDLVAWGETTLPYLLAEPGLDAAVAQGARSPEWARYQLDERDLRTLHDNERSILRLLQGGKEPLLGAGTIYLAGAEELRLHAGEVRRANAVIAWKDGVRLGRGGKLHLVPGAESLAGLERLALVRDTAFQLAGYIPDLVAEPEVAVVDLPLHSGRTVRTALSVCFDNTFEDVYARGTEAGAELHCVVSNEAWYEESFEYDQMIAFSRVAAVETGRALVRATNAGISALARPDGRVESLSVGGKDRMVRGTLAVELPVPVRDGAGGLPATPYNRMRRPLLWGLALAPFLALSYLRLRKR